MVRDLQSYERPADWDKKQVLGPKPKWEVKGWKAILVIFSIYMLGVITGANLT